jgi:hypothetical protein
MKINREHFLVLASALATGVCAFPGCTTPSTPPEEPRPRTDNNGQAQRVTIPIQPLAPPTPRSSPKSDQPAEPKSSPAVVETPPSPSAAVTKSPNPYDGTPVTAQSCDVALNRQGTAPACTLTAPGPTCESFGDTKKECPTLNQLLKPRVAAAAIECLRRKSGTQEICEFNITSICAYEALGAACLDPTAKVACDGVMAKCGGTSAPRGRYNKMTRESCEAGVSGIADAKRKKFVSCISESCRFETCLAYL